MAAMLNKPLGDANVPKAADASKSPLIDANAPKAAHASTLSLIDVSAPKVADASKPPLVDDANAPKAADVSTPASPPALSLDDYSKRALATALYPSRGANVPYAVLGLVGEAGEVADKVKKALRDRGGRFDAPDVREALAKELGDVLW